MREIYYVPLNWVAKPSPVSMMSAYNRINGKYASEYKKGFTFCATSWFDGVMYWTGKRCATGDRRHSGCDIEFPYNGDNYEKLLTITMRRNIDEQIDACASRVVDLAYRCKDMQKGKE